MADTINSSVMKINHFSWDTDYRFYLSLKQDMSYMKWELMKVIDYAKGGMIATLKLSWGQTSSYEDRFTEI